MGWVILVIVLIVGGWTARYFQVKNLADRHGLDTADLMMKDLFGSAGAVDRELAEVALKRSEETNRRLDRERAARQKAEQQQRAAEQQRLASAAAEVSIQPANRPVAARLADLDGLVKQGLITADEAKALRAEILKEV
jgi:sRNA-binding protein